MESSSGQGAAGKPHYRPDKLQNSDIGAYSDVEVWMVKIKIFICSTFPPSTADYTKRSLKAMTLYE